MSESKQNNALITADFMQYVGKEGVIDFEPFVRDAEDSFSQLKVTFLTLPDIKYGKLIYDDSGKDIKVGSSYSADNIKYVANGNSIQEANFNYYITDSDKSKSDKKTVVINATASQKMDEDSQLIGTEGDDILIADSYKGNYIWGAGGNDLLIGNDGENIFVIEDSGTKINKTITTLANFEISEDKIDLSQLTCVQNINDLNIDSKGYNTQITLKNSALYPQEVLVEKIIPTSISENYEEIFIFNNNQNDIENKCDKGVIIEFLMNKYTLLSVGFTIGMIATKLTSCIHGKFEKSAEITINLPPDTDRSIISQLSNLNKSYMSNEAKVPIGITFEEGKEIELISLKDSNTYFKYNEIASKTSWVGKSDGILFYDYNKLMSADHKKIVMTEWSKNAKTDFEAVLEVFDTNKDKKLDNKDDKFSDFYVWQDKNSNGAVEEGELKSLKEHGIESINFNESKVSNEEQQKQGILNVATVEWEDGKITNAYDLVFTTEEVII